MQARGLDEWGNGADRHLQLPHGWSLAATAGALSIPEDPPEHLIATCGATADDHMAYFLGLDGRRRNFTLVDRAQNASQIALAVAKGRGKSRVLMPNVGLDFQVGQVSDADLDVGFYPIHRDTGTFDVIQVAHQLKKSDVLFLVSPGNPTGVSTSLADLQYLLRTVANKGAAIIADHVAMPGFLNAPTLTAIGGLNAYKAIDWMAIHETGKLVGPASKVAVLVSTNDGLARMIRNEADAFPPPVDAHRAIHIAADAEWGGALWGQAAAVSARNFAILAERLTPDGWQVVGAPRLGMSGVNSPEFGPCVLLDGRNLFGANCGLTIADAFIAQGVGAAPGNYFDLANMSGGWPDSTARVPLLRAENVMREVADVMDVQARMTLSQVQDLADTVRTRNSGLPEGLS